MGLVAVHRLTHLGIHTSAAPTVRKSLIVAKSSASNVQLSKEVLNESFSDILEDQMKACSFIIILLPLLNNYGQTKPFPSDLAHVGIKQCNQELVSRSNNYDRRKMMSVYTSVGCGVVYSKKIISSIGSHNKIAGLSA